MLSSFCLLAKHQLDNGRDCFCLAAPARPCSTHMSPGPKNIHAPADSCHLHCVLQAQQITEVEDLAKQLESKGAALSSMTAFDGGPSQLSLLAGSWRLLYTSGFNTGMSSLLPERTTTSAYLQLSLLAPFTSTAGTSSPHAVSCMLNS